MSPRNTTALALFATILTLALTMIACGDSDIVVMPDAEAGMGTPVSEASVGQQSSVSTDPSVTPCAVFDPSTNQMAEWACGAGEVCALDVDQTRPGQPSAVSCVLAPQCAGDNVSCGCLIGSGINPCPGSDRQCEGVLGHSVTCVGR